MEKKFFFWSTSKNNKVTYKNIRKIATGQGDDYTTGCLLDYIYFKNYYKTIAVDLSIQQALNADSKAIKQINLTAYLDRPGNARIYFVIKRQKKLFLNFRKKLQKVLWIKYHNVV